MSNGTQERKTTVFMYVRPAREAPIILDPRRMKECGRLGRAGSLNRSAGPSEDLGQTALASDSLPLHLELAVRIPEARTELDHGGNAHEFPPSVEGPRLTRRLESAP